MRFLKNKIALSAQAKHLLNPEEPEVNVTVDIEKAPINTGGRRKRYQASRTPEVKCTKTIVKNYGKAAASFAVSALAVPYLEPLVKRQDVQLDNFVNYISQVKEEIEGIDTFRSILLIRNSDSKEVAAYKKVFQEITEVFIKYFSVNWIFGGRMQNKIVHLKFRFKILRRVQNPELFTYLK